MKKSTLSHLKLYLAISILSISTLSSCKKANTNNNTNTHTPNNTNQADGFTVGQRGTRFKLIKDAPGRTIQKDDFITLHLRYTTANDSTIYNSYNKPDPLSFRFKENLYNGVLNSGLHQMSAGDSAIFYVNSDSLYAQHLPPFLKPGEQLRYTVSMLKVQTQQEFQEERIQTKKAQQASDSLAIHKYFKKHNLQAKPTSRGVYKITQKKGSGKTPGNNDKVKVTYTAELLDGTKVLSTNGKAEIIMLNRQIALREGITQMQEGETALLIVPSTAGFRTENVSQVPPNSVLAYTLTLKEIVKD